MVWFEVAGRTLLLYFIILIIFRLMGKREIGELSVLDLVIFIMLGELAVMAIEDIKQPIWNQVTSMVVLMTIQITLSYISLKNQHARKILDGEPVILIREGKIDEKEMRRQRYNFDDLLMQLRDKDIGDIRDVEYAILEPSGRLSVFQKQGGDQKNGQQYEFVFPLILDGIIQEKHLHNMNKSKDWLLKQLRESGYENAEHISYCSFYKGKLFVDEKDE